MSVFKGTSKALEAWLETINFELFVTSHFPNSRLLIDSVNAILINECLRPIATTLKTSIAAVSVIVPATDSKTLHVHSAIISKDQSLRNRIDELKIQLALNQNKTLSNPNAINIQPWRPRAGYPEKSHPYYFVENMTMNPGYSITVYNRRLITKELQP